MPEDQQSSEERKVKTLAIRLDMVLHAQLSVIAQLRGSTITDEIREALATHVAAQSSNTALADSASQMLEEIEREADAKRQALSALLGSKDSASPKAARRSGGRLASAPEDSATS